jgi:hypothetical protein
MVREMITYVAALGPAAAAAAVATGVFAEDVENLFESFPFKTDLTLETILLKRLFFSSGVVPPVVAGALMVI